jgi:hypothetical protein
MGMGSAFQNETKAAVKRLVESKSMQRGMTPQMSYGKITSQKGANAY